MKPILDISGPVVQKLAALALFEQMQEVFNLRPASMAHAFNTLARQKSVAPLQLVHPIKEKVQGLLETCLSDTVTLIQGHRAVSRVQFDREIRDLQSHFNLDPVELATGIMDKVRREEMGVAEALEAALWLQQHGHEAFEWAFAQTEHILRDEAEQEDE